MDDRTVIALFFPVVVLGFVYALFALIISILLVTGNFPGELLHKAEDIKNCFTYFSI